MAAPNRVMFVNQNLQKLMVMEKILPKESFAGNYTLSLPNYPGYELDATELTFTLKGGCNTHIFTYLATSGPRTFSIGPIRSTRKACLIDNDNFFLDAFRNSVGFVRDSAGGFVLHDSNGNSKVRANNQFPPE